MGTTYWWRCFLVLAATSIGSGAFPAAQGCRSRGWEQPTFPLGFAKVVVCTDPSCKTTLFLEEGSCTSAFVGGKVILGLPQLRGRQERMGALLPDPLSKSTPSACSSLTKRVVQWHQVHPLFLQPQSLMAIVHCECFLMQSQSKDML